MIQNIYQAKQALLEIMQYYPIYLKSLEIYSTVNSDDIEIDEDSIVINDACKLPSKNPVMKDIEHLPWEKPNNYNL